MRPEPLFRDARWLVLLLVAVVAGLACQADDDTDEASTPQTGVVADATPTPTVASDASPSSPPPSAAWQVERPPALPTGEWTQANGGLDNRRSRAGTLDAENIERFDVAWEHYLTGVGPYGSAAGAPVIEDGVVYMQTLDGNVFATSLDDGALLWEYSDGITVSGPAGPAVADGRVFASVGGSRVAALDADDGSLLWETEIEKDGYQPLVAGDTVLIGTGNHAHVGGNSGFLHALDAATGEIRWSFQVIEEGFWGNPTLNSGGGVWYPPAVDLERGLVYVGTGNAGPYPGTQDFPNGSSRPGPNLYTSSLVALDLEDGELVWYHQVVPHGLFDHDFQAPPVMTVADVDGEPRPLVIGSGKVGRVVALDRETEEVVWEIEVGRHENDDLEAIPLDQVVTVYPGIFGGVETPMAEADGRLFVPVVNLGTPHTATGHGSLDGSGALLEASLATNVAEGTGELIAIDTASGDVAWRQELPSAVFGGATVLGELVFTATYEGIIYGFDRASGELLWTYEAGGGINAWPAVGDDTIIWPVGLGPEPRLIAFRLSEPESAPAVESGGASTEG